MGMKWIVEKENIEIAVNGVPKWGPDCLGTACDLLFSIGGAIDGQRLLFWRSTV